MKKIFLLLVLLPLLTGNKKSDIAVLDIDKAIANMEEVKLSSIVSSLEYVPLETTDDVLLDRSIITSYIDENYILIQDWPNQNSFLFNRGGKFIARIGRKGNGPGEISGLISDIYISPQTGYIYLFSTRQLLVFDTSGRLIEEKHPVKKVFGDYGKYLTYGGTDQNMLYFTHAFKPDTRSYRVFASDGNGNDSREIQQHFNVKIDPPVHTGSYESSSGGFINTVFFHNDYVVFYDEVSHMLSYIGYDGTCKTPYMIKNTGHAPDGMPYHIGTIVDSKKHIFIGILSDKTSDIIYFKKNGGKLVAIPGISRNITNDIDNGADFWPLGETADGKLYSFTPSHLFKEAAEKSDNRKLQTIAEKLKEDDNQVLVLASLK